jgi:hypothetical protein
MRKIAFAGIAAVGMVLPGIVGSCDPSAEQG